jgi:hypothetical protein
MSYIALATTTLGSAASTITFSSIPATYRDLIVVSNFRWTSGFGFYLRLNGDTTSSYSQVRMFGQDSSGMSSAGSDNKILIGDLPFGSNTNGMNRIQIFDYSATDKHKTTLSTHGYDPNHVTYNTFTVAGRWAKTEAVNSVTLLDINSNVFQSGSTFSLYGVA